MSLLRLLEASILDCRPIVSQYLYPLISLKFLDNKWVGLVVTMATQIALNFIVFPNFGKYSGDIPISVGMCLWFFIMVEFVIPNLGLTKRTSKEKLAKMAKDHKVKEP